MDTNPHDPSPAAPPTSRSSFVAPPMPFTVGNAFGEGGAAFKSCYGPLLGVGLIWSLSAIGLGVVGMVIPCLNWILGIVLFWPLYPGLAYVGITAVRERRVRVEDMFVGFRFYGRSLLLRLLVVLATIVVAIPAAVLGAIVAFALGGMGSGGGAMAGAIAAIALAFVPVAYVSCRLALAFGLSVDPVMGPLPAVDALTRSWSMTRDVAWPLVGLYVLVILMVAGSSLLLGIGYFLLGIPLSIAVAGATYVLITAAHRGPACRQCGYSFEGLTGAVCPECGGPV